MSLPAVALTQTILPASLHNRLQRSPLARRLVSGSLWSLAGSATARVLVLVAMVLVARTLGPARFGEFGLIQTTLGVAGLMAGLGLGGTATRFVAQHANSAPREAGRVIGLVMLVSWGAALGVAGVLVAASAQVARLALAAPELQRAVAVGALLLLVTTIRGIQSGVLAGLERFNLIARLNVVEGMVSLVGVVALVRLMGVEGALLGLALGSAVAWLIGRALLSAALRTRGIQVTLSGCRQHLPILAGYSLPSLMANLVGTPVLWFAMALLARSAQGYQQLGLYNAAYQWHGPIMFIPVILMSVSIPILVQEWEAGRVQRFRKVIASMYGVTLAITLPVVIPLAVASPWIMTLYGQGFERGWIVLVLLLAAAPLHALAKIASAALLGMNRAWSVFVANLAWGLVLCAISLWLVPTYGATGLGIAFVSAHALLALTAVVLVMSWTRAARGSLLSIPEAEST